MTAQSGNTLRRQSGKPVSPDNTMNKLPKSELCSRLTEMLEDALQGNNYSIKLVKHSRISVCGVQEGELYFKLSCRVFKRKKEDPTPAPQSPRTP
jgi:hypothetical protein